MRNFSSAQKMIGAFFAVIMTLAMCAQAAVTVRVDNDYEDSVRIVVLYNPAIGVCSNLPDVGVQTKDFVINTLAGINPNKGVIQRLMYRASRADDAAGWQMPTSATGFVTVDSIVRYFSTMTGTAVKDTLLPHVIVHINAGWGGKNGTQWAAIQDWALKNYVGIVEVGDDASDGAKIFGFNTVDNVPAPMGPAQWLTSPNDKLYTVLDNSKDKLVDATKPPHLKGIVTNAKQVANSDTLFFKPYSTAGTDVRCEADADAYTIASAAQAAKITFLGYQQAYNSTVKDGYGQNGVPVGTVDSKAPGIPHWYTIAALQDTLALPTGITIRRAVSLSMQPQFLKNTLASEQLTYDAIIFASLAFSTRPIPISIQLDANSIKAGEFTKGTVIISSTDYTDAQKVQIAATAVWSLDPDNNITKPGDSLTAKTGATTNITGTKAFRSIRVHVSVDDPTFTGVKATAVKDLYVNAGPEYAIYIEKSNNSTRLTPAQVMPLSNYADSTTAKPLATITMGSTDNTSYGYSYVRDKFGNIIRIATNATWELVPTTPVGGVTVVAAATKNEGIISRGANTNLAKIRAFEQGTTLIPDTVDVKQISGNIVGVRLVDGAGTVFPLESVTLNTNESQDFKVQLQWSTDATRWVDGSGTLYFTNPGVRPEPPTGSTSTWKFEPTVAGVTNLVVEAGAVGNIKSDTITISVTVGPPVRVTFVLIDKAPIAGLKFTARVTIYNDDGVVPGNYCFDANNGNGSFSDIVGISGTPLPRVFSTSNLIDSANLNASGVTTNKIKTCFAEGNADMQFRLFKPASELVADFHKLTVSLGSAAPLVASTETFVLKAGAVSRIEIIDNTTGLPVEPSISLQAPSGVLDAKIRGYDAWGNVIPVTTQVSGAWTKISGTMGFNSVTTGNLRYGTDTVTANGNVCIQVSATENPAAKDSVCISVRSAPALYVATTKDYNGNGYLDHIELTFNKVVDLTSLKAATISVVRNGSGSDITTFTVDSLIALGNDGKTFQITLKETATPKTATNGQTGWTPDVTITGYEEVSSSLARAKDGAPVVVWLVQNKVDPKKPDHTNDEVSVIFSEPLKDVLGNSTSENPNVVLDVWKGESKPYVDADSMLLQAGNPPQTPVFITSLTNANTAVFRTVNGKYLDASYLISLKVTGTPALNDAPDNQVVVNNEPVRVQILGVVTDVKSAPNPMTPNVNLPNNPGHPISDNNLLVYVDPKLVLNAAQKSSISATVITIQMPTFKPGTMPDLRGTYCVYDMAGNLVHKREAKESVFNPDWLTSTKQSQQFAVGWNGMNDKGVRAAPGAYRLVLRMVLKYADSADGMDRTKPIEVNTIQGVSR